MKDKRMFKLSNSRATKLATKFMVKRGSIFVAITWLVLILNPVSAFSWTITNISPNQVQAGCEVTLAGSFENQGNNTVRYWVDGGQHGIPPIKSWSGSTIRIDTDFMANGNFWIGIFSGDGTQLAKATQTLRVEEGPCMGSSGKPSIRSKLGFGSGIQHQPPMKLNSTGTVTPGKKDRVKADVATRLPSAPKIMPETGIGSGAPVLKKPEVNAKGGKEGIGSGIKPPQKINSAAVKEFTFTPIIYGVRTSDGRLRKSGGEMRIKGTGFGGEKGKVYYRILEYHPKPLEFRNVGWVSNFEILGSFPSNIPDYVLRQYKLEYQVETSKGRKSKWYASGNEVSTRPATRLVTRPAVWSVRSPKNIYLGREFVIEGIGFGNQPGNVIIGLFDGTANYVVKNLHWDSSRSIRAIIPKDLGKNLGRNTLELSFYVHNHNGKKSDRYNMRCLKGAAKCKPM